MAENITFHFEGASADSHRMNFYEAARFQYAAARLLVKLAQFRHEGKFVKKITNNSNFNIELIGQTDGSFNINVEDPGQINADNQFVKISLGDLLAYVSERVVEKIDQAVLVGETTDSTARHRHLLSGLTQEEFDGHVEQILDGNGLTASLPPLVSDSVKRRAAEIYRERRLEASRRSVSRIDVARGQRLVAMSAPLLSEMATALRRSADTLQVSAKDTDGPSGTVLFLDRGMAQQIETASVDDDITTILVDVIQFNKDNGWGKARFESGSVIVSFNIPSDILPSIRQKIIDGMNNDQILIQAYFVRDKGGKIVRLIVVGVLPTPED